MSVRGNTLSFEKTKVSLIHVMGNSAFLPTVEEKLEGRVHRKW